MDTLPFGKPGHWYRGNLHTHSTNSDGLKSPRDVCAHYRRRGYHFISLTDHFLASYGFPISDTTPYRSDRFTTVIGAELHAPRPVWATVGTSWRSGCRSNSPQPEPTKPARSSPPAPRRAAPTWRSGYLDRLLSQGPEILGVTPERGGKLSVRTSPVRTMRLTGRGSSASVVLGTADITAAELDLARIAGPYARLTVFDKRGRRAWTNPFRV